MKRLCCLSLSLCCLFLLGYVHSIHDDNPIIEPENDPAASLSYPQVITRNLQIMITRQSACRRSTRGSVDIYTQSQGTGLPHRPGLDIYTHSVCIYRYSTQVTLQSRYSTQVTLQSLPDDRFLVIGGRAVFSYEFLPGHGQNNVKNISPPFLSETCDKPQENNRYPFAHLSPDGNIFLFANNHCIPHSQGWGMQLPFFGGSKPNAVDLAPKGQFPPALCGHIHITKKNDTWRMEDMPLGRTLDDMLLLPNRDILIINGASLGCAGWDFARDPVHAPLLYRSYLQPENRFIMLQGTPS